MTRSGDVLRAGARGTGELLITAGLVLLLFVAYQLVWTNIEAERAQSQVADDIRDRWQNPQRQGAQPVDVSEVRGLGFLWIPRLGKEYSVPVVQGVDRDDLSRGVGHYPDTVRAGKVGNFAVAGHRATHGEPFANLDRVRPGDVVVAETQRYWFTYVVDRTRIVNPSDVWVVDPVPGKPGAEPTQALLTLTTCNPRWASTQRLIVFGHLEDQRDRASGPPPTLDTKG